MRSSPTISLFTEQSQSRQKVSSFVISLGVHAAVLGLVTFGLMYAPRINTRVAAERYTVRSVDLDQPEAEKLSSAGSSSLYPGPRSAAQAAKARSQEAAPPSSRRQIDNRTPALQTLVQPDIPLHQLILRQVPLPALLLWSADKARAKNITPPPPHERPTADVRPSLNPPNKEVTAADLQVSSNAFASETPMPPPANTSPVTVHGPEQIQRVPETTSAHSAQPASAAVMSLSDLSLAQGTVVLPPANEAAPGHPSGALATGPAAGALQPGNGDPGKSAPAAVPGGANSGAGNASHAVVTATGQGGQGGGHSTTRINLPPNGRFGVVVVGSTMQEQYPETAGLWNGRVTYSVYLHVGLAKNWILQYSLPRSADAAAEGYIAHLDAPWPYTIVRPDLAPGTVDSDALMIHGFVNEAGRFEGLAVVFPPEFAQAKLILDALQQWQFRPAAQNGKPAKVEVLLIIPEVQE